MLLRDIYELLSHGDHGADLINKRDDDVKSAIKHLVKFTQTLDDVDI